MHRKNMEEKIKQVIELKRTIYSMQCQLDNLSKEIGIDYKSLNNKHHLAEILSRCDESINKNKEIYLYCISRDKDFALNVIKNQKKYNDIRIIAFNSLLGLEYDPLILFKEARYLYPSELQILYDKYHEFYFNKFKDNVDDILKYCIIFKNQISINDLNQCIDLIKKFSTSLEMLKKMLINANNFDKNVIDKIDSYLIANKLSV